MTGWQLLLDKMVERQKPILNVCPAMVHGKNKKESATANQAQSGLGKA
jgi:hypothetical protein